MPSWSRSHATCVTVPSGSVDVDLNVTVSPAIGLDGDGAPIAATGGALTRNVAVVVLVWPRSSVTCRATVVCPAVVKVFLALLVVASPNVPLLSRSQDCDAIVPSGSVDCDASVTEVPTVGTAGVTLIFATGAWLATTFTVCVALADSWAFGGWVPSTVSLTVLAPGVVYVCDGPLPLPLPPSPKSQLWLSIDPPAAAVDVELNVTGSPWCVVASARGLAGLNVNWGVGGAASAVPAASASALAPASRLATTALAVRRLGAVRALMTVPSLLLAR